MRWHQNKRVDMMRGYYLELALAYAHLALVEANKGERIAMVLVERGEAAMRAVQRIDALVKERKA